MTLIWVLAGVAVTGMFVAVLVAFVQRSREPFDLSLRGLVRAYLYLASLTAVIVFTVGLGYLIAYALGSAISFDFVYGGPAQGFNAEPLRRHQLEQDVLRGVTFTVVGILFWAVHRAARVVVGDEPAGGFHRAYLMLGTATFGIATIGLLPFGLFSALNWFLIARPGETYRPGAGEMFSGALATLLVWVFYLVLVLRDLRPRDDGRAYLGRSGPPPEPAPVGARIGPGPSSRYAGAQARPPETT